MDVVGRRMSLTAWGRLYDFDKSTTARRHHAGRLPPEIRIERRPNGRCHGVVPPAQEGRDELYEVNGLYRVVPPAQEGRCVVYARVSSADRQVGRVVAWATQQPWCWPDVFSAVPSASRDGCPRRRWRPGRLHRTREDVLGYGCGAAGTGASAQHRLGRRRGPPNPVPAARRVA